MYNVHAHTHTKNSRRKIAKNEMKNKKRVPPNGFEAKMVFLFDLFSWSAMLGRKKN